MKPFGLLNINKPAGMTSRQVVDRVQQLVRPAKAGHAGTLDPLATGVLVVCVGPATRLIEYVQQMPKRYLATFQLGCSSPTLDVEGEVTPLDNPPIPSREQIEQATRGLVGSIEQLPPAFSALKVAGHRAYDLARAGKPVDLQPRTVTVHRLEVLKYDYPELTVDIQCGSGTYVRSLGRDLAAALETEAVMSALVRTAIGSFLVDEACEVNQLTRDNLGQWLLSPLRALDSLPRVELSETEAIRISQGLTIDKAVPAGGGEIVATDASGNLLALLKRRRDGTLGPVRNFPPPR